MIGSDGICTYLNESKPNVASLKMNDFLEILESWWFFFWKDDDGDPFFFFFLKMKEAWSNAPSLKVVFMTLKNLDWSIFEKSDADDDLKKKKKRVRHVWMPQFSQKKYFRVFSRVKDWPKKCLKTQNSANEHQWGWVPFGTFRVPNGTWSRCRV